MKKSFLFTAIGMVLIGAQFASANDSLGVRLLGRMDLGWGITYGITINDGYLYFGNNGRGLGVIDYRNPAEPRWVRNIGHDAITSINIVGRYAYCTSDSGIAIYDLSNEASPRKISSFGEPWGEVAISGNRLYATRYPNVVVYDLTQPDAPDSIGTFSYGQDLRRFQCVDSSRVVLSGDSGLSILDVSNPSEPIPLGLIPGRYIDCYTVLGDNVLILGPDLYLYDISDPSNIILRSVVEVNSDWHPRDMIADERNAFILNEDSAHKVVDISAPDHMEIIGSIPNERWGELDPSACISEDGQHMYISGLTSAITAVDIRNPRDPVVLSRYYDPWSASVIGDYTYLCTGHEYMHIADVTDPTAPRLVRYANTPAVTGIVSANDRYFGVSEDRILHELDFTDPLNPREIRQSVLPWYVQGFLPKGNRLYLMGNTFAICELNDSSQVHILGECDITGEGESVSILGTFAFVTNNRHFAEIVDISEETRPSAVGWLPTTTLTGVTAIEEYLYASSDVGVEVIDNSNRVVAHLDLEWPQLPRSVSGDYLFVGSSDRRLNVIDVSDPANPQVVGYYQGGGGGPMVAEVNGIVYTWGGSGLSIYDCSEALGIAPKGDHPVPTLLSLSPAYPNPFNSSTSVTYQTGSPGWYALEVVDISGRLVERLDEGYHSPGSYRAVWNAQNRVSGTYLIRLRSPRSSDAKSVTLVR